MGGRRLLKEIGSGAPRRTALLRLGWSLWVAAGSYLGAHPVDQLYAELVHDEDRWALEVQFDAGYAKEEWRLDEESPPPQREWLVALSRDEQLALCREAERYLRECLSFRTPAGREIEFTTEYIDFDVEPPDFPDLLTGGAYFRILLQPVESSPEGVGLHLAEGRYPTFVVRRLVDGKRRFQEIQPAGSIEVLAPRSIPAALPEPAGRALYWVLGALLIGAFVFFWGVRRFAGRGT